MFKFKASKLIIFMIFSILLTMALPLKGYAMGDPIINLHRFLEDAFRVHFDAPETLSTRGLDPSANQPPGPDDRHMSLHAKYPLSEPPAELGCGDFEFRTYEDWYEGRQKRIAGEYLHWPAFSHWNSPVYIEDDIERTIFGNLRSARFTAAVLDEAFDASLVVDPITLTWTTKTQNLLSQINGYGYDGLSRNQFSNKEIELLGVHRCAEGFSIFEFRIG